MKIALIRPRFLGRGDVRERLVHNRLWSPLSLARCARILEESGSEIKLIDAQALGLNPGETARAAGGYDLVLLSTSPIDRWECPSLDLSPVIGLCRELRRNRTRIALIGAHGTIRPQEVQKLTGADFVIEGEPESAMVSLGSGETPPKRRAPVRLDDLPFPAYDLLNVGRYRHLVLGGPCLVLEGSRGCPNNCTICLKAMYGNGYRTRSGQGMLSDYRRSITLGARAVVFIDLDFCLNRSGVEEFCHNLSGEPGRVPWCCTAHPGSVDGDLLNLMGSAGCRLIHYGIETSSQRILARLGRPEFKNDLSRVLTQTRAAGIFSLGFFLFGAFDETEAEREETLRLALSLPLDFASFHIATPYPGTAAGDELSPSQPDLFPGVFPGQDRTTLEKWTNRTWRRFYLRPRILAGLARARTGRRPRKIG